MHSSKQIFFLSLQTVVCGFIAGVFLNFIYINSAISEVKAKNLSIKLATIFDKVPLDASISDFESAKALNNSRIVSARNGFATFNVLIRADADSSKLNLRLAGLSSENGNVIKNKKNPKDLFDFNDRPIELFFTRYLEIKGLSKLSYEAGYDERHVPIKFRRPWSGEGQGRGTWSDRPDANKKYPDILVPIELVSDFAVKAGEVQSIVGDIYISKEVPPEIYRGKIEVLQNNETIANLDLELEVLGFDLPEQSPAAAMLYIEEGDISSRYQGERFPQTQNQQNFLNKVVDNHFKVARRHGIDLFNKNEGVGSTINLTQPRSEWLPRLSGELYTARNGYKGPGEGVGNSVFVIGAYGNWVGKDNPDQLKTFSRNWQAWFEKNLPNTSVYFYLADESNNWAEQEAWAKTLAQAAPKLLSFATVPLPEAVSHIPSLSVAASWFNFGRSDIWEKAVSVWREKNKEFILYNGKRPLGGSFATEDDGIALRVLAWSQVKMGVKRWFFWNATYYKNFQGGTGETNVFESAHTFGGKGSKDSILGETGWNYSNGDGVLFYPGTDKVFPKESYGIDGPLASLRLKLWRSGIEDAKYIQLAYEKNPAATKAIMQKMLPKVLWQVGVADPADPTWKKTDLSWSVDPKVWENARLELIKIIIS